MAYDLIRGFTNPTDWSRGAKVIGSVGDAGEGGVKKTMLVGALAGLGAVGGWLWWQGRKGRRKPARVGGSLVMMHRSPTGRITSGV